MCSNCAQPALLPALSAFPPALVPGEVVPVWSLHLPLGLKSGWTPSATLDKTSAETSDPPLPASVAKRDTS